MRGTKNRLTHSAAACCVVMLLSLTTAFPLRKSGGVSAAPSCSLDRRMLRVMTYNIHVGIGVDKKNDLARVASVINRERPDLVAVQEVDRGVERTTGVDQMAELARLTRMEFAYAPNLRYQGGWYGVAVLSRFPILAFDHRRYAEMRDAERRGFIRVEVDVGGGRRVSFVNTHLDYKHDDNRLYEARQLLDALRDVKTPLVIAGDFNDPPTGDTYRAMLASFADVWLEGRAAGDGLTYPSDKPAKRIDYIFANRESWRVKNARVVSTEASDHLPLVAELEMEK